MDRLLELNVAANVICKCMERDVGVSDDSPYLRGRF